MLIGSDNMLFFGNKSEEGSIERRKDPVHASRLLEQIPYFMFDGIPKEVEKIGCKSIKSESLTIFKLSQFE